MSFNLPAKVSRNFLAVILCFKHWGIVTYGNTTYSVKNTTSGFIWSGSFDNNHPDAHIIIVPRSIFSLKDGDESIELTADAEILGIHLLYRTEITMIDQSDSSNVNVVEERLLCSTEITMTEQSESPNVNVVEESLLYKTEITMIDQSDSPNVNVVEERWYPSKWLKLLWVRPFWRLLIFLHINFWKKFKNLCYLFWPHRILYWVRRRLAQYKDNRKKRGKE